MNIDKQIEYLKDRIKHFKKYSVEEYGYYDRDKECNEAILKTLKQAKRKQKLQESVNNAVKTQPDKPDHP